MEFLTNTANLLASGQPVTIGYIGGSITEFGGCDGNEGWRRKVTNGICRLYPRSEIREVCSAISGTGSDLAACRVYNDLISERVNLVFIEFSVNDMQYDDLDRRDITKRGFEGLIRQLIKNDPYVDIVIINTITKDMSEKNYDKAMLPWSVYDQNTIASHYNLPVINVGRLLRSQILIGKGSWEIFTQDNCHPSEVGYDLYANFILSELEANLLQPGMQLVPRSFPIPLYNQPIENGCMITANSTEHSNHWKVSEYREGKRKYSILCADTPGAWIKSSFIGSAVGAFWVVTSDSGNVEWRIDGSKWKNASVWDKDEYVSRWPERANYKFFATHLDVDRHELELRISTHRYEKSSGDWVKLIAILAG